MSADGISDEVLNALVDGQLEVAEGLRVLEAAQRDEHLAAQICALLHTKELVRLAYADPPHPRREKRRRPMSLSVGPGLSAVAALLLSIGVLTGWVAHGRLTPPLGFQLSDTRVQAPGRFILHVADADPAHMDDALNDTESLVRRFEALRQPVRIEVVANGDGLALLNAETSPYGQRIRDLVDRYPGVAFLACAQAVEHMRLKGKPIRLLPDVKVIQEGALDRIITRLQQGWSYIRV